MRTYNYMPRILVIEEVVTVLHTSFLVELKFSKNSQFSIIVSNVYFFLYISSEKREIRTLDISMPRHAI